MCVNLQNMWEAALFSGKNYTTDKNFTRPPVTAVAANFKSEINQSPLTSSASSSLPNAQCPLKKTPPSTEHHLVRIIMLCQLELFPSHLPSNFDIVVSAVWSTTNRVKKKESLEPRTKNQDQVYCVWLMKWVIKREIFQLAQLCPTRWSIISDTSWY